MRYLKIFAPLGLIFVFLIYTFLPVKTNKTVEISYGKRSLDVGTLLYKEGILRSPLSFMAIHVLVRGKLEAGEYEFSGLVFPWDVYLKISRGQKKLYKITIPEGYDIYDIANTLEKHSICKAEDFIKLANSPDTAKKYGLRTYTIEGFLFPDTYYFSKNTHPIKIIDTMFRNFLRRTESLRAQLDGKKLTLEEWVIIASMIEKETGTDEERSLVSSVIHNRVKKNMPLQIDPTVIYALKRRGEWNRWLTRKHLQLEDPYNTYYYKGLPPSPICNPGIKSLEAALNPAKTNYLYFVSMGNGRHVFSSSYEEHLKNIAMYRK
ncbi:endolytic transglycosylase MltG [Thermocrinis sp.]|uniref:endolytic transglycosylase MltG n=1 Tax=Thermocrinis sp. TaxID=2024383 RepID=UPI002FDCB4B4